LLNLYRIMTDVRAGSDQPSAAAGQLGIVTLWVRAKSESVALDRATSILANKRYGSIGSVTCYAEVLGNDPLSSSTEEEGAAERREDSLLAGYDAVKKRALSHADGLHEVWLYDADCAPVEKHRTA
jgi:hypothetical protein